MPADSREVSDTVVAVTGAKFWHRSRDHAAPARGGGQGRGHHRAAAAAAASCHPVAAVEHGAEQVTAGPQSARVASNGQHRGTAAARQAS